MRLLGDDLVELFLGGLLDILVVGELLQLRQRLATNLLPATECTGPVGSSCAEYEDFDAFDTWEEFFAEHPLR